MQEVKQLEVETKNYRIENSETSIRLNCQLVEQIEAQSSPECVSAHEYLIEVASQVSKGWVINGIRDVSYLLRKIKRYLIAHNKIQFKQIKELSLCNKYFWSLHYQPGLLWSWDAVVSEANISALGEHTAHGDGQEIIKQQ